jgi:hypothetical protein
MTYLGRLSICAALALAGAASAEANGRSDVTGAEMIAIYDKDGDSKISAAEIDALIERDELAFVKRRSELPVYINGYERHMPRNKIYYLHGGAIIVEDPGPSRFYR